MKLASEAAAGLWAPWPPGLDGLIARLDALSQAPLFAAQREMAVRQALTPYLEGPGAGLLQPFGLEVELATLGVYADYYPRDGQLTLIEQLRDVVTEHIPEEERAWLDPLKHSYMDLVEVLGQGSSEQPFAGRSLGDGRGYTIRMGQADRALEAGQVLLSRFIQLPGDPDTNDVVIGGAALVLSSAEGRVLYEQVGEYRREMEFSTGAFELGDWHEFAKRFGHVLLWMYRQLRLAALMTVVATIRYRTPDGQPYLYALALYEHHAARVLRQGLEALAGFEALPPSVTGDPGAASADTWVRRASGDGAAAVAARLTLTPTQLWVEADSRERLDALKHELAATFGFTLHFRGEATTPPPHLLTIDELNAEGPLEVVVSSQQDADLLKTVLETVYLEWADRDAPVLGGKTPRHAAVTPEGREQVGRVIDEMERHDPGWRRIGRSAYAYDVLRGHVGLEPSASVSAKAVS